MDHQEFTRHDLLSLINWRADDGSSYLHLVVSSRSNDQTEISDYHLISGLLMVGCDVNAKNHQGDTPLLLVNFRQPQLVELLLKAGADVKVTDSRGRGPLHLAAESERLESVKLVLDTGVDVNQLDREDKSALYYAVENDEAKSGVVEIVKLLVERGAQINRPKTGRK